ncbi:MAG: 5'-methylthioadenosine/adenosylhomocysteine nucleosidase [Muribaculaceae bacterium]|nr:5'-methylthioadenosine/adenosylhomocysteine nucleosidase [Muribaculaceae bacterium]
MKIVILTAMDKELQLIQSLLENSCSEVSDEHKIYKGKISAHDIVLAKCGIGKVNAAINTFRLILSEKPDLILNTGVAGGAGLKIGSLLIADQVAYDDVWCGPGTKYGEADGCPLFFSASKEILNLALRICNSENTCFGLICSGDKFISKASEIKFIREHFPEVKAVDMESAAIAQVCYLTDTPFNIIRVVSDTPGEGENIEQYKNFWQDAPQKTFNLIREIIEFI